MKKPSERYERMSQSQYDAEIAKIESELANAVPISDEEWRAMKRAAKAERKRRGGARVGAGRKPKPAAARARRIIVSMPPDLLAAIDAAAIDRDISRAALIAQGMRKMLGHTA